MGRTRLLSGGLLIIRTLPIQWDNFMAYADNKDLARFLSQQLTPKAPPDNRHWHFHYRVGISSFYKRSCQKIRIKAGTVHDIVQHLQMDRPVSKLLSGFHALTGSDTTSYLTGHTKTWWVMFKEHHYLLQGLGDGPTLCTKTVRNAEQFLSRICGSVTAYSIDKVDQICSSKACQCQWTSSLQLKMLFVSHQLFSLPSNGLAASRLSVSSRKSCCHQRHWIQQQAQLPQRNSASAAHVEGARSSSPLPLRPLWLHLCVWSNSKATTYVRQACVH